MEKDIVQIALSHWEAENAAKAEILFLKAAKSGNGHAAHNLGTLYATGAPGVKPDSIMSQYWYERALASGLITYQFQINFRV